MDYSERNELVELLVKRGKSFEEATKLVLDHERRGELDALDTLAEKILAEGAGDGRDFWTKFRARLEHERASKQTKTTASERLAPKHEGLDRLRGAK